MSEFQSPTLVDTLTQELQRLMGKEGVASRINTKIVAKALVFILKGLETKEQITGTYVLYEDGKAKEITLTGWEKLEEIFNDQRIFEALKNEGFFEGIEWYRSKLAKLLISSYLNRPRQ